MRLCLFTSSGVPTNQHNTPYFPVYNFGVFCFWLQVGSRAQWMYGSVFGSLLCTVGTEYRDMIVHQSRCALVHRQP